MTKINEILSELVQQTIDGNCDPLEVYIHLKIIEKKLDAALKEVEPIAYNEAQKWSEKTFEYKGAKIEKKNAPSRYDFKSVSLWVGTKERLSQIEELAKIASKGGATVIDELTGEVIEPALKSEGKGIISVQILSK